MEYQKLNYINDIFKQFLIKNPNSFSELILYLYEDNVLNEKSIQDFLINHYLCRNQNISFKENWQIIKFFLLRDIVSDESDNNSEFKNNISYNLFLICLKNFNNFINNDNEIKNQFINYSEVIFDMNCILKCLNYKFDKENIQKEFFLLYDCIVKLKEKILQLNNRILFNILKDFPNFQNKIIEKNLFKEEFKNNMNKICTLNKNNFLNEKNILNNLNLKLNFSHNQNIHTLFSNYNKTKLEIKKILNLDFFKQKINEFFPGNTIKKLGSYPLGLIPSLNNNNITIDLMIFGDIKNNKIIIKSFEEILKCFSLINEFDFEFSFLNTNNIIKNYIQVLFKNKNLKDFSNQKLNLRIYCYNQIFWYSSTIIEKLYINQNIRAIHIFYNQILIEYLNFLKNNFELIILILNFLTLKYGLIKERKKGKFNYFNCKIPQINSILIKNNTILFYPEFDKESILKINNMEIKKIISEFSDFLNDYFSYILKLNNCNIEYNYCFNEDNFNNENFIFNRGIIDNRYINLNKENINELKKKIEIFNLFKKNIIVDN